MHGLVVFSHPSPDSLTGTVARRIGAGIEAEGHAGEIADLSSEGFDPRFGEADMAHFRGEAPPDAAVAAEQERLDRADALVLVYPVYWWSFPGLLKGWIDRVFDNGWAYDDRGDGKIGRKLGRLPVHLVAIGGADLRTYARHGYFGAMRTQIDHGVFGYCGAPVRRSELLLPASAQDASNVLAEADRIGRAIFEPAPSERAA